MKACPCSAQGASPLPGPPRNLRKDCWHQRVPVNGATVQRAPGQGATPVLARPRRARRPPLLHHITIAIVQITVETGHTPADAPVLCASPAHGEAGDRGFVPSGAPGRPVGSAWARRGRSPPTCQRAPVLAQLAEYGERPLRLGRRRHHLRAGAPWRGSNAPRASPSADALPYPASARAVRTCPKVACRPGADTAPLLSANQRSAAGERALASMGACVQRRGSGRAVAAQARGGWGGRGGPIAPAWRRRSPAGTRPGSFCTCPAAPPGWPPCAAGRSSATGSRKHRLHAPQPLAVGLPAHSRVRDTAQRAVPCGHGRAPAPQAANRERAAARGSGAPQLPPNQGLGAR